MENHLQLSQIVSDCRIPGRFVDIWTAVSRQDAIENHQITREQNCKQTGRISEKSEDLSAIFVNKDWLFLHKITFLLKKNDLMKVLPHTGNLESIFKLEVRYASFLFISMSMFFMALVKERKKERKWRFLIQKVVNIYLLANVLPVLGK